MVVMRHLTHQEIADAFNVGRHVVARLSSELKRSSLSVIKRREREIQRAQQEAAVIAAIR